MQDNIETIKNSAFNGCSNIEELQIPISLNAGTTGNIFSGCSGLIKVKFTKGTGIGVDYTWAQTESTIYSTPWYISKDNDKEMEIEFEEGITKIGSYMLYECKGIKKVNLPKSLKTIGEYAFSNCTGIQSELTISNSLTLIGKSAFSNCSGINGTVKIPDGITEVSDSAFSNTKLTKLVIHDNVTKLGNTAFSGCSEMKELQIPISLNAGRGGSVFSGCSGLTKVKFTKGTGTGVDYTWAQTVSTIYFTPWYISKKNGISFIIEKDINYIGEMTTLDQVNPKFYFTGTEEEWNNVQKGKNNSAISSVITNYIEE